MHKKEINISSEDMKKLFYIFFIPLLLTFIIEHFSKFHYSTRFTSETAIEVQATDLRFVTPFGSKIYEDVVEKNLKYELHDDGISRINGYYAGRFPYYLKGLLKDILYPLSASVLFIMFLLFSKKFRINIKN